MAGENLNYTAPGPFNVYVPGYSKKNQAELILRYNLNEENFKVNQYHTLTNVPTMYGFFPKFNIADRFRIVDTTGASLEWPDGKTVNIYNNDTNTNRGRRTTLQWELKRYLQKDTIGDQVVEMSPIDEVQNLQQELASKQMAFRSLQLVTLATTATNWSVQGKGRSTDTVSVSNGSWTAAYTFPGAWSGGSITNPIVYRTMMQVYNIIKKRTGGVIQMNQLVAVINPDTAYYISGLAEIRGYLAQQSGSIDVLKGENPRGQEYILPNPLYGIKLLIEDTVKVTGLPTNDADTISWMFPVNKMLICARPGAISSGLEGSPFSTFHCFQKSNEAMKPITEHLGNIQKATYVGIEDTFQFQLVTEESGFLIDFLDSTFV